jgi:small nuclear ribonucleoprotein (snRNP)-like protein
MVRETLALYGSQPAAFITSAHRTAKKLLEHVYPEIREFENGRERELWLRPRLDAFLWHDLVRLRALRNNVEHENYVPFLEDQEITKATLLKAARLVGEPAGEAKPPVRQDSGARDWRAFAVYCRDYFSRQLNTALDTEVTIKLSNGDTYRVDLASRDRSILIECKSYTYTRSGNEPAAKLAHAKQAAQNLQMAAAVRKLLIFEDHLHPISGKSLAELFARRNARWLDGVEIWRRIRDRTERIH